MDNHSIAVDLGSSGFCVCPNFLTREFLIQVRADLTRLQMVGALKPAGIGAGKSNHVDDLVRRDHIYWLNESTQTEVQHLLLAKMAELQLTFNRQFFMGIREFEAHYAVYAPGGYYDRHFDSIDGNNTRVISIVLYLNLDWKEGDGGELKLYDEANQVTATIKPIGGTLVCFFSNEQEHEVALNHKDRFSFTGWFKT